jgi:hypothetical protein
MPLGKKGSSGSKEVPAAGLWATAQLLSTYVMQSKEILIQALKEHNLDPQKLLTLQQLHLAAMERQTHSPRSSQGSATLLPSRKSKSRCNSDTSLHPVFTDKKENKENSCSFKYETLETGFFKLRLF